MEPKIPHITDFIKIKYLIPACGVIILLSFAVLFSGLNAYGEFSKAEEAGREKQDESPEAGEKKENPFLKIPADIYEYLKDRPEEMLKYLKRMEYYKQKEDELKKDFDTTQNKENLDAIRKSASDEIKNIAVLVGEIPLHGQKVNVPAFMADRSGIFGTTTDFSFKWVGYKATLNFRQDKFPWKSTSLSETIIGSFLYASGTNIGFNRGKISEEKRFYTNYFSEVLSLKKKLPKNTAVAFTLDSRQYFFVRRDTPSGFKMPLNHINIFPRLDLSLDFLKVKGIDQLTSGLGLLAWGGYGIRNRWESWGEPGNLQSGENARTFTIYSFEITGGVLFGRNHNFVIRGHYKGGTDNDFLTQPRFGGTIDNANLDVVHGFTLDRFRVREFGLANVRYGFDIIRRFRFNLFFDYAHVFSPERQDIFGSGWGVRIIAWGGLPVWFTHGIGRTYYPEKGPIEQVFMVMTAAGW